MAAEKEDHIKCGRLQKEYVRALRRIFKKGISLGVIELEDLSLIRRFCDHARQCDACSQWRGKKDKTLSAALNKEEQ